MDEPKPNGEKPYARQSAFEVILVCILGGAMLLAAILVGIAFYDMVTKLSVTPDQSEIVF